MPIKISDKTKCSGCHACFSACPKNCISMIEDKEGFLYPTVDHNKCINCELCEKVCPVINCHMPEVDKCGNTVAAINKDDNIRIKSSSGGIFTSLAEKTIEKGGTVFGAAFDDEFSVKTVYVETKSDLDKLRGSKYVQSTIGQSYRQAKFFLQEGRDVLFSGTPCQIGGLYAFLDKDYDNLITVDFICHGVPSPLVWKKYLDYRKKTAQSDIAKISFRYKNNGWKKYSVLFEFSNNTEYLVEHDNDPFMRVFLDNYCLRPSCYNCAFKTKNRQADITLADFWGIENIYPEMDDDKGTSLAVIHSKKGKYTFQQALQNISVKKSDITHCNYCYLNSVKQPKDREYFLKRILNNNFNVSYNKLYHKIKKDKKTEKIKSKTIYRVKTYLRKIINLRRKHDS